MAVSPTALFILDFISDHVSSTGYPPSQTEISKHMGFSGVRAAQYWLEILEDAGLITKSPGVARGLRLTSLGHAAIGEVTA